MKIGKPGGVKSFLELNPGTVFAAQLDGTKSFFLRSVFKGPDDRHNSAVLLGPLGGGATPSYIEGTKFAQDLAAIEIDEARFDLSSKISAMDFGDEFLAGKILISGDSAFLCAPGEVGVRLVNIETGEAIERLKKPYVGILRWSLVVGQDQDEQRLLSFPPKKGAKAK